MTNITSAVKYHGYIGYKVGHIENISEYTQPSQTQDKITPDFDISMIRMYRELQIVYLVIMYAFVVLQFSICGVERQNKMGTEVI